MHIPTFVVARIFNLKLAGQFEGNWVMMGLFHCGKIVEILYKSGSTVQKIVISKSKTRLY